MQSTMQVSRFAMSLFGALALGCNAVAQTAANPFTSAPTASPQAQSDFFSSQVTLDRVIDRFLQRNLSIEAARYQVDVARAEQIAARIRPNPASLSQPRTESVGRYAIQQTL
jgi:hypothetical protein